MAQHEWVPTQVGHGVKQCKWCKMTLMEATVLGFECAGPRNAAHREVWKKEREISRLEEARRKASLSRKEQVR